MSFIIEPLYTIDDLLDEQFIFELLCDKVWKPIIHGGGCKYEKLVKKLRIVK
jgi:hypothetical protein